jgi:hypothetical protein
VTACDTRAPANVGPAGHWYPDIYSFRSRLRSEAGRSGKRYVEFHCAAFRIHSSTSKLCPTQSRLGGALAAGGPGPPTRRSRSPSRSRFRSRSRSRRHPRSHCRPRSQVLRAKGALRAQSPVFGPCCAAVARGRAAPIASQTTARSPRRCAAPSQSQPGRLGQAAAAAGSSSPLPTPTHARAQPARHPFFSIHMVFGLARAGLGKFVFHGKFLRKQKEDFRTVRSLASTRFPSSLRPAAASKTVPTGPPTVACSRGWPRPRPYKATHRAGERRVTSCVRPSKAALAASRPPRMAAVFS